MAQEVTDPNINSSEHTEENIKAKKVVLYGWYPASLSWERVQTDQNGVMQTSAQLTASIINVNSDVTVYQGGAPWLVNASVIGFPNVNASIQGIPSAYIASAATLSIGAMPPISVTATNTTVYQGGAPWTVLSSLQGTPAVNASIQGIPNILATTSPLGVYNSIFPSLVSLQTQQLQLDQHANLLTNIATVTAPVPVNASIQGTVPISGFPVTQNVIATIANASIPVTESGAWNVTATIGNTINVDVASIVTLAIGSMPAITVTATNTTIFQGGAPWLVNASIQGIPNANVSLQGVPNVLATVSPIGIFNSIAPSLVSLQTQIHQIDQHANLLTNIATVSAPLPVTGTFWQTTQNVIATIANASIPVTESGAWGVTATIGNTVNVAESGAWNVTATIGNVVNALASLQGVASVNASIQGTPTVQVATSVTLAIGSMPAISVTATNTTIFQGGAPWLINASVVGQQAVTATVAAPMPVVATYAVPWNVVASQGATPWLVNASTIGNLVQVMASTSNAPMMDANVMLGMYTASIQSISSSATLSYYPPALDINGNQKVVLTNSSATVTQGTNPWLVSASVGTPTVNQGTSPWVVDATVYGAINVIPTVVTVLQGTSPWLVNASIVGQQAVTASIAGNIPVTMTTATLNVGNLLNVNATYAAPWLVTSTNAGGYVANSADANVTGTSIFNTTALTATCLTVKVGNTNMYGYHIFNNNSAITYISLFAQTLATMGKTVATSILAVPAGGWADASSSGPPVAYAQALLIGASTSINGTGNPTTNILANIWYK